MPGAADFEPKQIFIAHATLWTLMEQWARAHNFHLDLIPTVTPEGNLTMTYPEGDTPTYAFMPKMPGDRER